MKANATTALITLLGLLCGGQLFGQSPVKVLQVGLSPEPPFVIGTTDNSPSGLSVDLWERIAREGEVDYKYVFYSDQLGLIRGLDFGEIDVSINPIHVNEMRLKLLSATQPFVVSSIGVATTQVEKSQLALFVRNFFSLEFLRIILLLVLIIFVFGTILWIAERNHNHQQFRPGLIGLFDGLWWSAVTMTTVGYGDKAPKSKIGRVIAMVWMFTAIIIISGFTATIASTLTVSSLTTNIEHLDDLQSVSAIGSVYGSSSADFLLNHDISTSQLYETAEEGLRALADKEIEVLIYDRSVLDYQIGKLQLEGRVSVLPVNFNQQYRSFFLPKASEHLEWINPLLVRTINEATWPELLEKYDLWEQ